MLNGRIDWVIPVLAVILSAFGLAIISSVAPALLMSQFIFCVIGFALFAVFSRQDYRVLESLGRPLYILGVVLLAITLIIGLESRGAVRWVSLGPVGLQFSELLKPFLVISLAAFLVKRPTISGLMLMVIPVILVFKQPDLGNAIVYTLTFGAITFISGVSWTYFGAAGVVAVIIMPVLWRIMADYQRRRLLTFFSPNFDPLGASYNAIQAVVTVGSGMLLGWGLGHGTQSHLLFLPERQTDFIFAAIGEEFGFVGAAVLLLVYFVLIWRIFRIAKMTNDRFCALVASGVGMIFLIQVFINVGMNLGVLPVTGITLPLVSAGGSSIISTLVSLGMVEMAARSV